MTAVLDDLRRVPLFAGMTDRAPEAVAELAAVQEFGDGICRAASTAIAKAGVNHRPGSSPSRSNRWASADAGTWLSESCPGRASGIGTAAVRMSSVVMRRDWPGCVTVG
jgi:hypothetical protein